MGNITLIQIAEAIGVLSVIVGAYLKIRKMMTNCYNEKVAIKFDEVDEKFDEVYKKFKEMRKEIEELDRRLTDVERKRDQYERELGDSKRERGILARGELSALKILRAMLDKSQLDQDELAESIKEIEEYVFEKSHD